MTFEYRKSEYNSSLYTVNSVTKDFDLGTFFQNKRTVPVSQGKSQTNNTSCVIAIVVNME